MDRQYVFSKFTPSLRKHDYGKNVKLIDDPYLLSLVVRLSSRDVEQPMLNQILKTAYSYMLGPVLNNELPVQEYFTKTKMYTHTKKAVFHGRTFDENTKFVITNLIRAGIIPSLTIYDLLFQLFNPKTVRLDNIFISRVTSKTGKVTGANIAGAKTGDSIKNSYILIPDPMGATGSSIVKVLNFYRMMSGEPKKIIIMGLIITPEYLKTVRRHFPEVMIYSVRLDRGLSAEDVLNDIPGKNWNREKGLNKEGYIIPGAGGLGEIINNTTF
jgi:uracil phosphoribosyltransferase